MSTLKRRISRRDYLRKLTLVGVGSALAACGSRETAAPAAKPANTQPPAADSPTQAAVSTPAPADTLSPAALPTNVPVQTKAAGTEPAQPAGSTTDRAYLAVARGQDVDPAVLTETALKALGGIEQFVKAGFDVIIKPNICTDYYPFEYGATTNPAVVAALVRLALGAGAKRVRVMDFPFGGSAESAYVKSGIAEAVKAAGGQMEIMNRNKFRMTKIPAGKSIQAWAIYQDALTCDLLIDVAVAKHHSLARMTAGQKNLLGVIQDRNNIHADMDQRIPDLLSVIKPGLTVIDAVRTLMRNGPTGGSLDDLKLNHTVAASADTVAADAFAATLFDLTGKDIPYIVKAAEMGLGTLDLQSVKVAEIAV